MNYSPKYAMQTGGDLRRWSNPQRTFHHALLKLNLECEADPYPGVLILTDPVYEKASAMAVKNLRNELSKILEPLSDATIAYWWLSVKDAERERLLNGLTTTPVFNDILG